MWTQRREDLMVNLLDAMARHLGFKEFDKAHLRREWYAPMAHLNVANELQQIRSALIEVLSGRRAIPIETRPPNAEEPSPALPGAPAPTRLPP